MRLLPDAAAGIMQDANVPGAEQLEQLALREKAVEYIYERLPGE